MPDVSTILSVLNLFIRGYNDASNVFGQKKDVSNFAAFGSLIPDVLALSGKIGHVPARVDSLQADDIGELVQSVAQHLDVPEAKAKPVIDAALQAVSGILEAATKQAKQVEAKMVEAKK